MKLFIKKRGKKVTDAEPNGTPEPNTPEDPEKIADESIVARVEKSLEDRVAWLERELRKLLRLPEDAPLD